jgi:thymidine kinase
MTDITLYPGGRGSGKTTKLMEQVRQAATVGQSVAIVVHTRDRRSYLYLEMKDWDVLRKPEVFSEVNLYTSRGLRLDHIFIDDADLFVDNPVEAMSHFHPGVPLTVTYTPPSRHALDMSANV